MGEIVLTKHARKRIRERLGIPNRGVEREFQRALEGLTIQQTTGRLKRWLKYQRKKYGHAAHYRVTPNAVFAFQGNSMVTVLLLPQELRTSATAQWKRHKNHDGMT